MHTHMYAFVCMQTRNKKKHSNWAKIQLSVDPEHIVETYRLEYVIAFEIVCIANDICSSSWFLYNCRRHFCCRCLLLFCAVLHSLSLPVYTSLLLLSAGSRISLDSAKTNSLSLLLFRRLLLLLALVVVIIFAGRLMLLLLIFNSYFFFADCWLKI